MSKYITRERGAALITVLLFVVLVFILITAMLSVSGNEVVIASLQRDSVQATDLAQAGLQEAIRRVIAGRPFSMPFTSAIPCPPSGTPCVTVTVTHVYDGANSAYLQIDATATAGRATRHLTALVLQEVITFPPNVTFANSVAQQGSANVTCGDVYAQTFIQYKSYPTQAPGCTNPPSLTYSGWRDSGVSPLNIAPCYTNADCVQAHPGNNDVARWYPGTRQTVPQTSTSGQDLLTFESNAKLNSCTATVAPYSTALVPAGAILADNTTLAAPIPQYGFDTDTPSGAPSQLTPSLFSAATGSPPPLCGLPYKWVAEAILDENNVPVTGGNPAGTRWFKTIIFDEWFRNYWRFDETQMTAVKRGNGLGTQACVDSICVPATVGGAPAVQPDLVKYPQFGAVPPFPDTSSITNNYDCKLSAPSGGTLNALPTACKKPDGSSTTSDLGTASRPVIFILECTQPGATWQINANITGYGTLVINCDNAVVNGTFTYNGTIIVNGTLQAGTGNVTVYGGLIAQKTLQLIGNITVQGGGTITNVPTGNSLVFGKAWWER